MAAVASYGWDYGDGSTGSGETDPWFLGCWHLHGDVVTDDKGATDTATKSVTVAAANQKPAASFTADVDLKVSVDGSGSADADGSVASYAWDYGTLSTGSGKTDSHLCSGCWQHGDVEGDR